jgi:hypothetical protein
VVDDEMGFIYKDLRTNDAVLLSRESGYETYYLNQANHNENKPYAEFITSDDGYVFKIHVTLDEYLIDWRSSGDGRKSNVTDRLWFSFAGYLAYKDDNGVAKYINAWDGIVGKDWMNMGFYRRLRLS